MSVMPFEPKNRLRMLRRSTVLTSAMLLAMPHAALAVADPSTLTTVSGATTSTITSPGNLLTQQHSDRAIIQGANVDVLQGESWRIQQPGSSSALLVRVNGGQPTQILGTLDANGQVMLVNGAGVFFGQGSQVNVAGLIASTADISNENFNANRLVFDRPGRADASIVNKGRITAKDGGLVALMAPGVQNDGVVAARGGNVALVGGEAFTVDFYGDGLYSFNVTKAATTRAKDQNGKALDASVANNGTLSAQGGTVIMSARAAKGVVDNAINTTGIVEAQSLSEVNGEIVLDGGDGNVAVAGVLDASGRNAGQTGGKVRVATTGNIQLASNARVDVSGHAKGGSARIGGERGGKAGMARAGQVDIAQGAAIDASGNSGDAGEVVVWSDDATRFHGDIHIRSQRGNGGFAEVSSANALTYDGFTDAGGVQLGTLLLDPGNWVISSGANSANTINVGTLAGQLNAANVTIDTASAGVQPGHLGDISLDAHLVWTGKGGLTLNALNDIKINRNLMNQYLGADAVGVDRIMLNAGRDIKVDHAIVSLSRGNAVANSRNFTLDGSTMTNLGGDITINNSGVFSNNLGHNINTGGSLSIRQNVGGSIQTAVDAGNFVAGDYTVIVGDGTYNQNVRLNNSSVIGRTILRSQNGAGATTITGVGGVGAPGTVAVAANTQRVTIGGAGQGFTLQSKSNGNPAIANGVVHLQGGNHDSRIEGNTIATAHSTAPGIRVNGSNDVVLANNTITGNNATLGVRVDNSERLQVTGGSVSNHLTGIRLSNTDGATINSITLADNGTALEARNGSSGVSVGSASISGGNTGVELNGAGTDLTFTDNGSQFTGQNFYFELENGAMNGGTLDASQQRFEGVRGVDMSDAEYADARSRTRDSETVANVGFVFYRAAPVPQAAAGLTVDDTFDQLVQRDGGPLRNIFSYSGQTVAANYVVTPFQFRVPEINLSLLAPRAGGPVGGPGAVPPTPSPTQLGNLSPAAGPGTLAALSPAAGSAAEGCGNSFLDNGLSDGNCPPSQ